MNLWNIWYIVKQQNLGDWDLVMQWSYDVLSRS